MRILRKILHHIYQRDVSVRRALRELEEFTRIIALETPNKHRFGEIRTRLQDMVQRARDKKDPFRLYMLNRLEDIFVRMEKFAWEMKDAGLRRNSCVRGFLDELAVMFALIGALLPASGGRYQDKKHEFDALMHNVRERIKGFKQSPPEPGHRFDHYKLCAACSGFEDWLKTCEEMADRIQEYRKS